MVVVLSVVLAFCAFCFVGCGMQPDGGTSSSPQLNNGSSDTGSSSGGNPEQGGSESSGSDSGIYTPWVK